MNVSNIETIDLENNEEIEKILTKEEEKIKAKRNVFNFYKLTYSKFNSYEPLVNGKLIEIVETKIIDDKLTVIGFADWLLQNQIGILCEKDMVNRNTKKQYLRKVKRFKDYFVKKINEMTTSSIAHNQHKRIMKDDFIDIK